MSEQIERTEEEIEFDGKPFRYIPRTTVGKVLLGVYAFASIMVALSVTGFVFADPVLVLGMPAAAIWAYAWYTVIFGVVVATFIFLFRPWAQSAERMREEELDDIEDIDDLDTEESPAGIAER